VSPHHTQTSSDLASSRGILLVGMGMRSAAPDQQAGLRHDLRSLSFAFLHGRQARFGNVGRFTNRLTWEEIVRLYRLTIQAPHNLPPRYNICPTDPVDVVIERNAIAISSACGGLSQAFLRPTIDGGDPCQQFSSRLIWRVSVRSSIPTISYMPDNSARRPKPSGYDSSRTHILELLALLTPPNHQSSRRNVLDVDADAVPTQRVRRVDRGDGQL
jgi:hypothetical protein